MSSNPETPVDPRVLEQKRLQINKLIEEVAKLSDSQLSPQEYYAEFLQRVLTAIAASAGAVWGKTAQGHLQLQYQINLQHVGLDKEETRQAHDQLLRVCSQQGREKLIPPNSSAAQEGEGPSAGNLSPFVLLIAPILIEKQVAGLIEIWVDPTERNPQAMRGFLKFCVDMADYASAYIRNTQLRHVLGQQQLWTQLEGYARQIHGSLAPREVGYLIVNEGRRLIQCDRVSVAVRQGAKTDVEAISGADVIEKRSSLVQTMRALFDAVIVWGEKLVYTGTKDDSLPPKVLESLDAYLAESASKMLVLWPLKDDREEESTRPCRSAMLVECFEPTITLEELTGRMEVVVRHAAPALYNAVEYRRLPFRWILYPLANIKDSLRGKRLAIAGAVVAALAFLVLLMIFIPYPLRMEGKGQLLPADRQIVYALVNGRIKRVDVRHLQAVSKGNVLLTIEDFELQKKVDELKTEVKVAEEMRNHLRNSLSQLQQSDPSRQQVELEAIKQTYAMERANKQLQIYLSQSRDALDTPVAAPVDGVVVTDLGERQPENLLNRVVKIGDQLMQVANVKGDWEIELWIPEAQVGHVRESVANAKGEPLDVDIMLLSRPNKKFVGKLQREKIGGQVTMHNQETALLARIEIDDELRKELDGMPVGVEVRAKIRCGNRAIGYVLFYELWEFFFERVLF